MDASLTLAAEELMMVRAAELYYNDKRSYREIAAALGITRHRAAGLLSKARELGIVRIEIAHPRARRSSVEARLKERFSLADAVVVPTPADARDVLARVADAAADYVQALNPAPHVLGLGWGHTLDEIAVRLPDAWGTGLSVVQLNGAAGISTSIDRAADTARLVAAKAGGTATLLPAPAILESRERRYALESEATIAQVLRLGMAASVYLFGVGVVDENSAFVEQGYVSQGDLKSLLGDGAVGEVLGHFIDARGRIVDGDLDDRTLGLGLDDVRDASTSIAVVAGIATHLAARAVVRSSLCTVLITDEATALAVLNEPA